MCSKVIGAPPDMTLSLTHGPLGGGALVCVLVPCGHLQMSSLTLNRPLWTVRYWSLITPRHAADACNSYLRVPVLCEHRTQHSSGCCDKTLHLGSLAAADAARHQGIPEAVAKCLHEPLVSPLRCVADALMQRSSQAPAGQSLISMDAMHTMAR